MTHVELAQKDPVRANSGVIVRCSENHQQDAVLSGNRRLRIARIAVVVISKSIDGCTAKCTKKGPTPNRWPPI